MAIIRGSVSGANLEVGATSKGALVEMSDSSGKLAGATKTVFSLRATNFTAATTEAMVTLTPARDGVESTTGTSFAVTAGKRLVLLGLSIVTRNAGAAVQGVVVRVRYNPGGTAIVSSSVIAVSGAGTNSATANVVSNGFVNISADWPSVIEISGTGQIGISQIGTATAGNDVVLWGYEY